MTVPLLRYQGVYKAYGRNVVLRNITFDVEEHTVTCLIGPSGCGKSTLLRCTNLLEDIQAGDILLRGENLVAMRRQADAIRRRIGMVFQSYNLFPHMTVMQNITLAPRRVAGVSRAEARSRAETLLARFGLLDKANDYPDRLSGGQQQRVAVIRALAMQPELLLLDEITSALDPEMVSEVLDVIVELKALGMTMILATHQMGFARNIADQVVFIDRGEIVERGDPRTFFDTPQQERTRHFLDRVLTAT
jgi:polar amino acid transport system ATP-binding protein